MKYLKILFSTIFVIAGIYVIFWFHSNEYVDIKSRVEPVKTVFGQDFVKICFSPSYDIVDLSIKKFGVINCWPAAEEVPAGYTYITTVGASGMCRKFVTRGRVASHSSSETLCFDYASRYNWTIRRSADLLYVEGIE